MSSWSTSARQNNIRLAFTASHALDSPVTDSDSTNALDIVLAQDLRITLSAQIDQKHRVSPNDIQNSALVKHIVSIFRFNAQSLGFSRVSDVFLDDNDTPQFTLSPSRSSTLTSPKIPHSRLLQIDLKIVWKIGLSEDTQQQPFATTLALPYQTILDSLLSQFINKQLIKRYPLIFGPWAQQLDLERTTFPIVFRSISHIIQRSQNEEFKVQAMALLKGIQRQSKNRVAELCDNIDDDETAPHFSSALSTKEAFCHALEHTYRKGLPVSLLKTLNVQAIDNDDMQLEEPPEESEVPLPRLSQHLEEDADHPSLAAEPSRGTNVLESLFSTHLWSPPTTPLPRNIVKIAHQRYSPELFMDDHILPSSPTTEPMVFTSDEDDAGLVSSPMDRRLDEPFSTHLDEYCLLPNEEDNIDFDDPEVIHIYDVFDEYQLCEEDDVLMIHSESETELRSPTTVQSLEETQKEELCLSEFNRTVKDSPRLALLGIEEGGSSQLTESSSSTMSPPLPEGDWDYSLFEPAIAHDDDDYILELNGDMDLRGGISYLTQVYKENAEGEEQQFALEIDHDMDMGGLWDGQEEEMELCSSHGDGLVAAEVVYWHYNNHPDPDPSPARVGRVAAGHGQEELLEIGEDD